MSGVLEGDCISWTARNVNCGDEIRLYLSMDDENIITQVAFTSQGCAISKSSASLMTGVVKGLHIGSACKLIECFGRLVRGTATEEDRSAVGEAGLMSGVADFPRRVRCAELAWDALAIILFNQAAKR